jgi:hypothetical protein
MSKSANEMGGNMELMPVPEPEEFTELIHQHVKRYTGIDQTYLKAIEAINKTGFCCLSTEDLFSILESYLIDWGHMGRVLGHKGCRRIALELKEIEKRFNVFQDLNLATLDIPQKLDEIE